VLSVGFITGMFIGIEMAAQRNGGTIENLDQAQLVRQMITGLLMLFALIAVLFFLFRMGFRKLFGNYISKLESTLKELEEIG